MHTTTLYALLSACDLATIDGYEVERTHFPEDGSPCRISWIGGDDMGIFPDQPLTFSERVTTFEVKDHEGETFSMEFFAPRPYLTPADVKLIDNAADTTQDLQQ